jgi:hypothetical protein
MIDTLIPKTKGQSLTEYSLSIALVALVAMVGLTILSNSINQGIKGITNKFKINPPPSVVALSAKPANASMSLPVSVLDQSAIVNARPCDTDGNCSSHVTGVNGIENTQAQSDVISSILNQLSNDPNADPGLVDLITKLANSGHKIADYETQGLINAAMGVNLEGATYQSLYTQLISYLASHPNVLSASMSPQLTKAADWISTHVSELSVSSNKNYVSAWADNVMGSSANTTQQSNTVCQNGGDTKECVK